MNKRLIYVIILVAIILAVRLFFFYQERHFYADGETVNLTYSFNHEPKENASSQYFFVSNVLVTMPLFPRYRYGDMVRLSGVVQEQQSEKGILLVVKNPRVVILEDKNPFISVSKFIRYRIVKSVEMTLPPREGGLLLGIVMGVRDKIDKDFYQQLKNVGVLHIIAASGQNISIAASLLLSIFEKFVKRRMAILFTGGGIIFYAFLTGFDPSIVRAAIMALITFGALLSGRTNNALYALFLTGVIMILHNPNMIEDISFQLSFLSTLGILLLKPILDRAFSGRILKVVKDDLTTTLSAQVATLPIMLASFGSYSLLTVPINMLVLWTVPLLMVFGGVGALLAIAMPILGVPFFLLSFPFLTYFTNIVSFLSSFNVGINFESFPFLAQLGYYLIVFALFLKFKKKDRSEI